MSVRAYKIVKRAVTDEFPTFNLWHNQKIVDWIEANTDYSLSGISENGGGTLELSIEEMEALLKAKEITDEEKKSFEEDLRWAKEHNEDHITYECF